MSALGQKWTLALSFDHFVGNGEQARRESQPECFSGLEVDDELEFRGRLHWQIAWLFTFQDAINIERRSPKYIDSINSIRHQAASRYIISKRIHCRQFAH